MINYWKTKRKIVFLKEILGKVRRKKEINRVENGGKLGEKRDEIEHFVCKIGGNSLKYYQKVAKIKSEARFSKKFYKFS